MAEPKVRFRQDDGSDFPSWKVVTIGEIVDKQSIPVLVNPEELYREIGIRSHGKGLFHKEPVQGIELGNKRVFEIVPDCLVVNIVFAWERAVSKTTVNEVGMIASHRFPMYKPKDGVLDLDYIVRYLITDQGKQLLELASPGGAGRNRTLGQKEFANSKLSIPCYEEQKKISALLVNLDDVITASEEEVANLETQKKAVMKKIFTQEVRFKRNDGTDFPEWEEKPFYDCVDISANMVQPDVELYGDMPHIGPGNIEKGTGHLTEYKLVKDEDLISGKYLFSETDVIYGKINPQLMKVAYPRFKGLCSADAYPLSVHPDVMLPEFLLYSLLESRFVKYSISVSMRTGMPKINRDELGYFKFRIPSLEEQRLIGDFLSDFDEAIVAAKKELELWKKLKKGLLQQMFV